LAGHPQSIHLPKLFDSYFFGSEISKPFVDTLVEFVNCEFQYEFESCILDDTGNATGVKPEPFLNCAMLGTAPPKLAGIENSRNILFNRVVSGVRVGILAD